MTTFRFASAAILAAVFIVAAPCVARAQIASVYVISSNTRFNNVPTGSIFNAAANTYTEQYTNFWASGIGGGVTLNFIPAGPVRFGIDLRGSTRPGTTGADTGMFGFRIGAKIPVIRIKPYIQASGGYVATRTVNVSNYTIAATPVTSAVPTGGTFTNRYAAYEIFGGIDYPIVHFLDFRVIEIGGGTGYTVGGSGENYGLQTISLFSVDSGIVVHF